MLVFALGSLPNSGRNIEPELLRIIMQNWRLDNLISNRLENSKLAECLNLVKSRPTVGSLATYDEFEFDELRRFLDIYRLNINNTITGSEPFPGVMLTPTKLDVTLPKEIYKLLVEYYNNAYELDFVTIADLARSGINRESNRRIVVLPNVNQFGRVRIGAEIFGSALAPRYAKNSHILAKFIQTNDVTDTFAGQAQYYFKHKIDFPDSVRVHHLAFVRWYLPAQKQQTRFHFRIESDDDRNCNVELWGKTFYEISRDSIIPVHNIYSRFISSNFTVGVRKPVKYMAVIPTNRHFHM